MYLPSLHHGKLFRVDWEGQYRVKKLIFMEDSGEGGDRRSLKWCLGAGEGSSGWNQAGPAPSLCPPVVLGPRQAGVCCSVLIQDFSPCRFSTVEYQLQLLHSPPAPVVKRPGALATHHPLQVLSLLPTLGSLPSTGQLAALLYSSLFLSLLAALGMLGSSSPVSSLSLGGVSFDVSHPLDLLDLPQEPSQPLNLTAKPKAPELPTTSSSPNLKMSNCGPRPPSHGAPTRDLQSSPPSLPLGKLFYLPS